MESLTLQNDFALQLWQAIAVKFAGLINKTLPEFPHLDNDLFENGPISLMHIADFDQTLHKSNEIVFLRNAKPVFACCNAGFNSQGCIRGDYSGRMSPAFEMESVDALIVLASWKKIMNRVLDKHTYSISDENIMLHPEACIDECFQSVVASNILTVLNELEAKEAVMIAHANEEADIARLEAHLKLLLDNTVEVETSLSDMVYHLDYSAYRELKLNVTRSRATVEASRNEIKNLRAQIEEKQKYNKTNEVNLDSITLSLKCLTGFQYLSCVFCEEDKRVHVLIHRQAHQTSSNILKQF